MDGGIYGQYLEDQALVILPPNSVMVLAVDPAPAADLKYSNTVLEGEQKIQEWNYIA
jgi:hypothetical protein